MATVSPKLSPIQVHLLRFFSENEISDEETKELQKIIAKYYADKADSLMENIWKDKGYSTDTIKRLVENESE
jgi:hypothetical protein